MALTVFLAHAVFTLLLGVGTLSGDVADLASVTILLVLNVFVAVFAFRAANRTSGATKWGWSLYAAGATGIVIGVVLLISFLLVSGSFDFAGFNFFLFVMANVLGVAALALLLPARVAHGLHARLVLDALVVAGCTFVITWVAGADTLFAQAEGPWSQRVTDLSYPFLNALLLTLVVIAVSKARTEITPSLWLLFLGVGIVSVTDPFYTWFSLNGYDVSATMVGTLSATGVILCQILAALRATDPATPKEGGRRVLPNFFAQAFPLLPVGIALPVVAVVYAATGNLDGVVFWTSAIVVALLLLRLGLTLADNRKLALELEATAELKSQMLGFISHEMANPLTPLRVQLYTLAQRDSGTPGTADRSLEIANRSVTRLTTLARDARSLTQLDAGQLKLDRHEHDLAEVVRAAFHAAETAAKERGVSLEFHGAPEPLRVSIDIERMGQVFDNLLSNALKFTPAGGKILVEAGADGYSAIVTVRDSGLGMSPQQLGQLFKPFSRVHGNVAPGTGLGLYICRGIVQSHGGEIWAESEGNGRGSSFHVRLELASTKPLRGTAGSHPSRGANLRSV